MKQSINVSTFNQYPVGLLATMAGKNKKSTPANSVKQKINKAAGVTVSVKYSSADSAGSDNEGNKIVPVRPIGCISKAIKLPEQISTLEGSECIVYVKNSHPRFNSVIGTIAGIENERLIINSPVEQVGSYVLPLASIKEIEVIRFWCDVYEQEESPVEIARRNELAAMVNDFEK